MPEPTTSPDDDFAAHPWAGTKDGHNCVDCGPDGFWRCAPDRHVSRWDEDPVAIKFGWASDGCGICGKDHAEADHGRDGAQR
jgi:hypothetical protein